MSIFSDVDSIDSRMYLSVEPLIARGSKPQGVNPLKEDLLEIMYFKPTIDIPDPMAINRSFFSEMVYNALKIRNSFVTESYDSLNYILYKYALSSTIPQEVDIILKVSSIGLTDVLKRDLSEIDRIHEAIVLGRSYELPNDVCKDMIRKGIIRFRNVKTGEYVKLHSDIVSSFSGHKIRMIASVNTKFYINRVEYDHFIRLRPEHDYIGTREEVCAFAEKIGMTIPVHARDYYTYYMDNYRFYSDISPNSEYIETSSDRDILKKLGVYISYVSRMNLINKAKDFLSGDSIMIFRPLSRYYIQDGITSIKGPMPTTQEDLEDIIDDENGICIGNYLNNYMISIEELIFQLKQNEPNLDFKTISMKPNRDFTQPEMYNIVAFLTLFPADDAYKELTMYLSKRIRDYTSDKHVYKNIKIKYEKLSDISKSQVYKWFRKLFTLGMYMRRWDGKGPYPMTHKETTALSSEYADKMTIDTITELNGDLEFYEEDAVKFINEFPCFDKDRFNKSLIMSTYYKTVFHDLVIAKVLKGNMCIRIASNLIIYSAYVFHDYIEEDPIPNFVLSKMELIA